MVIKSKVTLLPIRKRDTLLSDSGKGSSRMQTGLSISTNGLVNHQRNRQRNHQDNYGKPPAWRRRITNDTLANYQEITKKTTSEITIY